MSRKMRILKPLDAAWMYVDTVDTPMQVACLAIFSLPADAPDDFIKELFAHLRSVQRFAPPFNLKLRSPRLKALLPAWVEDEHIDLDYHLRHSALPKPGGERELGVLISRLHSHPMDFNRPLWECHIIEGLENNRFALYMKMHHALVDGIGGMRMLQRMLSPDPQARTLPPPWAVGCGAAAQRDDAPSDFDARLRQLAAAARTQLEIAPAVAKALGHVVRETVQRHEPQEALPFAAPHSVLNARVSAQRRFATQHYELERVRAVAKASDATLNDVFLALCAAALRRYLLEIDALPEQPLTAGVPVSVRPADDQNAGNAISFIIANLNTDVEDPLERLRRIRESTHLAKAHLQRLPKAGIDSYTMIFMAPFILQLLVGLAGKARPMFNVTISNVPGPKHALYFNGARMEQMYPVSLLSHGQALNITAVSYDGQFNIGYTGCRDTLPSMQRLAVYTGEALEELERALGIAARRQPEPARKTARKREKVAV
ncbi:acyltransferase, WS/DGAT/MGAT [Fontimonas thermophila]|uniref:diacylglycerol O-acyltransferase n=2 Tax=Fontimonas thermophila TaxID=1076937 RepID=A0A1I2J8U8_9GAMM|nr:wax ester/triacylglycerol synthase family O-acyltransferase [Fontimonas thermophila]SFF51175.1 acyltransferase, WS/DGAT/MGAT [Fontimonas thermophila]